MKSLDRKLLKTISRITKSYDDVFYYDAPDLILLPQSSEKRTFNLSFHAAEVLDSLNRLDRMEYIHLVNRDGLTGFEICPRINHRFDWWFDEFTKRFWGGFATGVIASLAASYIYDFIMTIL